MSEHTPVGNELREEFQCACWLDEHPKVRFWFRNLEKRRTSFHLQTSTDFFYPDFVCMLKDGRVLVVEYKGGHQADNDDSREKSAIGEVWAARSKGKALFCMPSGAGFGELRALFA